MSTSYEQLDFVAKAIYHIRKAEEYQSQAEKLELVAGKHSKNDQMAAHLLSKDEVLAFPYRQATGNRNGHQQRAIMYGIMALVKKAYDG